MRRSAGFLLALWVGALSACAPTRVAAAPGSHDRPVPADEPRAQLKLELDLPKTASCEEDFDLRLYANPAVDLIEWRGNGQKCSGRRVTISYLSRRTDADKVLMQVKGLAANARVMP
ncbi:MAG TPA: hypothetical protein VFQ35_04600 [Polyangiaceae bacterium]|nr:hypothetical protein [Polyangiaceae bacterium]